MSGVASPDCVITGVPFIANSPLVGTSAFSEQGLQDMILSTNSPLLMILMQCS